MNSPLFRPEVLLERQTQWLGTVLLAPRLSHRLFALYALLVSCTIGALLFFGEYTRTAKVSGWLVPEQGMVRVFAAQTGVATALFVKEGAAVQRGERLLTLSTELHSTTLGDTQAQIARGLNSRRESMQEELRQQKQIGRAHV